MNKLDVDTKVVLMNYVKETILDMVNSYLNKDECDLDIDELIELKNMFDALCKDRPLDNGARVYLKIVADNQLGDALNVLRDKVDDNPKLRSDVDELLMWFHIARDI